MDIPIIGKEEDMEGCVAVPVLLQEILRSCTEKEPLRKPITTMLQILAEMAQLALSRQDPQLTILALRLGLFPMPNDKLKKALEYEATKMKAIGGKPEEGK